MTADPTPATDRGDVTRCEDGPDCGIPRPHGLLLGEPVRAEQVRIGDRIAVDGEGYTTGTVTAVDTYNLGAQREPAWPVVRILTEHGGIARFPDELVLVAYREAVHDD